MLKQADLSRVVRSCAKWRTGFLLVACLGLSPAPLLEQRPPGAPHEGRHLRWSVVAVGDTIVVKLTFPAGARATGARWSVQAALTNGTWSGLPVKAVTTSATSATLTVSAVPWDSVSFTGFLWGTQGALVSKDSTLIPVLKLKRPPGAPGLPAWDTSATVIGLLVKPDTVSLAAVATRQLCAFVAFKDGKVARRTLDASRCDSIAARVFTVAQRAVTPVQQLCADTAGYCYNPGSGLQSRWLNEVRYSIR